MSQQRQNQQHPWALATTQWPEVKRLPFGINLHLRPGKLGFSLSRRPRPIGQDWLEVPDSIDVKLGAEVDAFTGCMVYNIFRNPEDSVPAFSLRIAKSSAGKQRLELDGTYADVKHYTLHKPYSKTIEIYEVSDTELVFSTILFVSSIKTTHEGSRYRDFQTPTLIKLHPEVEKRVVERLDAQKASR